MHRQRRIKKIKNSIRKRIQTAVIGFCVRTRASLSFVIKSKFRDFCTLATFHNYTAISWHGMPHRCALTNSWKQDGIEYLERGKHTVASRTYVCTLELPVVSQWATRSAYESDVCKMETGGTIKHGRVKRGMGRTCASLAWFLLITPTKFSLSSALAVPSKRNKALLWVERPALCHIRIFAPCFSR